MYHQLSGLVSPRTLVKCVRTHRITRSCVNTRPPRVVCVNRMRKSAISIYEREIRGVDLTQTRVLAQDISVAHIRVLNAQPFYKSRYLSLPPDFSLLPDPSDLGLFPVCQNVPPQIDPPKIRKLRARNRNKRRDILYFTIGLMENVKSAKWSSRLYRKFYSRRHCTCFASRKETTLQA